MSNEPTTKKPPTARVSFSLPPDLCFAAEALAAREYSSVSVIARRALASELIYRGYLQGEDA